MPEKKPAKPAAQTSGPSTPIPHDPGVTTPLDLVVTDTDPQVGKDGLVYVSDAISDAAVAEGYAPDIQPRHHPDQETK